MSDRHFFHDKSVLVDQFLRGFTATRPDLRLKRSARVVHRVWRDTNNVALISGGGGGHEPGAVGMVGQGGLDAAIIGDIFASPRAEQVLAAIEAVPSHKGTILITPNYTGDNLHFGLGRYMAKSQGIANVELVVVGDDISLPRSQGALVGRRCLAGIILVCKILGAASEAGFQFDQIVKLGRAISPVMASVCAALDHCHIPGRGGAPRIGKGLVEIGLGLHNEKGVITMAQPRPDQLVQQLLDHLLSRSDGDHDYLKTAAGDTLVLIANNQGGMSFLELGALLGQAVIELAKRGIPPARSLVGSFMGSMNMPGFSFTLLNVSSLAATCDFVSVEDILELLDATHSCASWPPAPQKVDSVQYAIAASRPPSPQGWIGSQRLDSTFAEFPIKVDPSRAIAAIRGSCDRLISIESELTEWDTASFVGDGDCGDTCTLGATAIKAALDEGLVGDGDLIHIFRRLTEIVQRRSSRRLGTCGGTLGAISAVFLGGITTALCDAALSGSTMSCTLFGLLAIQGLDSVKERTTARVGHRTIMDALIPFCATLSATGGLSHAVEAATRGAESTRSLRPRLGRAAYIGKEAVASMTPDPGAMAFVAVVQGICEALTRDAGS